MLNQFRRDRRGNITVLSAIMTTTLVGVAGLVADYGNGLLNRMHDQRMSDTAAMAGATVYSELGTTSAMNTAVGNFASLNGYASGNVSASLVSSPTGDGNQAVKVVVNSTVPLTFTRVLLNQSSVGVTATSYAELKSNTPGGCVLALDPTAHQAITISGSANVQEPNCTVVTNSDNSDALDMSGSAVLKAACTVSVGGQNTTSGLTLTSCKTPTTHATAATDPYATLAAPTSLTSGSCLSLPNPPTNIPGGYYCNGMNISGTATFQSDATFYIKGNLAFQGGSNVSGTHVTFFIDKSGTTAISGSAVVNLSAPSTGTYAGILFFGDRAGSTSNNNNISGASTSVLTGTLYYPTQQVTYSGGSSSPSNCTHVIADTITFSGSTYLGNGCSSDGVASITASGGSMTALLVQ